MFLILMLLKRVRGKRNKPKVVTNGKSGYKVVTNIYLYINTLYDLYMEYTRFVSHNERANWRTRFRQTAALSFFFDFVAKVA